MTYIIYGLVEKSKLNNDFNWHTDGYIGLTSNLKKRLSNHKNHREIEALRGIDWDEIYVETLHEVGDKVGGSIIEQHYRPYYNIGYNRSIGGGSNGRIHDNSNKYDAVIITHPCGKETVECLMDFIRATFPESENTARSQFGYILRGAGRKHYKGYKARLSQ